MFDFPHSPPNSIRGVYFGLKNQYEIVLNIVKIFFIVYDAKKKHKKIETIVLYFVIKKNLEVSFHNGLEHETTSLSSYAGYSSGLTPTNLYKPHCNCRVELSRKEKKMILWEIHSIKACEL